MNANAIAAQLGSVIGLTIMMVIFFLLLGLIVLVSIKSGRWVALRIQKACRKPADAILRPSKIAKYFDKQLTANPKPQLVKEKKIAKGGK